MIDLPPPYQLVTRGDGSAETFVVLAWDTGRSMYREIATVTDADHAYDVVAGLELLRRDRLHRGADPDLDAEGPSGHAETTPREVTLSEGGGAGRRLVRNSALCANCGDELESTHRHDWVQCRCGSIFIDGGHDYMRRGAKDPSDIIDTSVWEGQDATPGEKVSG